jgi:hypothetical protein
VPDLKLPANEKAALEKLQALSEGAASNLLSAIKSAALKADTDGLTIDDLSELSGLSKGDADKILETLVSLYHYRAYAEVGLDEFIDDICRPIESSREKNFQQLATPEFRARLAKFLGLEDLNRAAKSSVLRYEHERTVHHLRILTDARPIFGSDAAVAPEAAVILHTLKIGYQHAGHTGEMFFGFDEHDLEGLKKEIQRAELKATSLRSVLAKAQVKVFNLE